MIYLIEETKVNSGSTKKRSKIMSHNDMSVAGTFTADNEASNKIKDSSNEQTSVSKSNPFPKFL